MAVDTATRNHLLSSMTAPLLLAAILYMLQHTSPEVVPRIFTREEEAQCAVDLSSPDACRLVREICEDFDNDGLIPYLRLYACTAPTARPFILFGMLLWLPVLFGSMAMAAAEFLAVHLEYIVQTVGISENLAGVTIFAFGNGCTDLFATLAAMGANSGSLAIGELFGAAAFITTVVLGLITIIQPFTVNPRSFVGDVVWFIVAGSVLVAFLADGELVLGECLGIIGLYIAFALFAILRPNEPKHSSPPVVLPASEGFRDEVEPEDSANDDADDLLMQDEDGAGTATSDSNQTNLVATLEEESEPDGNSDSPYLHDFPDRDDHSESEGDHLINAQELDDLWLPPTASATNDDSDHVPIQTAPLKSSIWKSFPSIYSWHEQHTAERVLTVFSLPFLFPIGLTIPSRYTSNDSDVRAVEVGSPDHQTPSPSPRGWKQRAIAVFESLKQWKLSDTRRLAQDWMFCVQLLLGPQLCSLVVISQSMESVKGSSLLAGSLISLLVSMVLLAYAFSSSIDTLPSSKDDLLVSIVAFTVSLIWIYLTATSAVTLLMTLALIFNIPAALLGATIFAIGQSSNDLVANTAVARRGMPVLAASASFGGPMINMFMGIGGGGLVQVLKSGGGGVYTFHSSPSLFVSAANLLLGLVVTLGYAFWNSWRLERGLGLILIGIWVSFTIVNVVLGMTT